MPDKPQNTFIVTCRLTNAGREFNPDIPVEATGYDDAVKKVKVAMESLGMSFRFVHKVTP
jgi:hypothetical protein